MTPFARMRDLFRFRALAEAVFLSCGCKSAAAAARFERDPNMTAESNLAVIIATDKQ